eukprot:TRINITY_DN16878_c1_g2_i1.p1 TRINITY_DN16878_c1_g2~~TRINITY_DN16878_c1_g2_i1.p1  ORF type:complete len:724 (-),score=138.54 TRINITY_DN16878_c1_g2_i1:6-1919(-)
MGSKERSPQIGDWLARCGGSELALDTARNGSAAVSDGALRPHSTQSRDRPSRPGSRGSGAGGSQGNGNAGGAAMESAVAAALRPPSASSQAARRLSASLPRRPLLASAGDQVLWRQPAPAAPVTPSAGTAPARAVAARYSSAAAVAAGAVASGRATSRGPLSGGLAAAAAAPCSPQKGREPQDEDPLVASLAARLAHAERLNRQQASRLSRQAEEMGALRSELLGLRRAVAEACSVDCAGDLELMPVGALARELAALRAERDRHQQQTEQMTAFLADYGLTWVGDPPGDDGSDGDGIGSEADAPIAVAAAVEGGGATATSAESCGPASPSSSSPARSRSGRSAAPFSALGADLVELAASVEKLNGTVERAGARVVSQRGAGGGIRARFATDEPPPLPLTFFEDGFKLGARPLQAYNSQRAHQLVRDIIDGYFPYELKDEFPDGVTMKVVDRTAHRHEEWLQDLASTDAELSDDGARCVAVIPGGRRLGSGGGGPSSPSLPSRGAEASDFAGEVSLLDPGRPTGAPAARLQVRLEDGRRVVLCMELAQTVGDLEAAVLRWHMGAEGVTQQPQQSQRALLRSAFPPRQYTDVSETLEKAGLTPTATLFAAIVDASSETSAAGAAGDPCNQHSSLTTMCE